MAAHDLPDFDPAIIERYVENTYRKATAVFLGSVVAGVMIGAVFGATPLTSLGASWPIPRAFGFATMLGGALVGGIIGYLIGDTRAFLARLQGQTALAQIQAAKDARLALQAVQQIQALATRRVAASGAADNSQAAPAPPPPAPAPAPTPVPSLRPPEPPLVAAVQAPVAASTPEPAPVAEPAPAPVPVPEPAPATVTQIAPPALEAVPSPPVTPTPAPPTLVVAEVAPPLAAEPAPPLSPPTSA
jgi:hypothetical protein